MTDQDSAKEMFFEVDKDDNPIGPIAREEANSSNNKYHRSIHVFLKVGDKYLISKRKGSKDRFPNRYDLSVSGHVNHPETYLQAAVRETFEELGIEIPESIFQELGKILVSLPWENEFIMNYLVTVDSSYHSLVNAIEAESIKLITKTDLINQIKTNPGEWSDWAVQSVECFGNEIP